MSCFSFSLGERRMAKRTCEAPGRSRRYVDVHRLWPDISYKRVTFYQASRQDLIRIPAVLDLRTRKKLMARMRWKSRVAPYALALYDFRRQNKRPTYALIHNSSRTGSTTRARHYICYFPGVEQQHVATAHQTIHIGRV